MLKNLIDAASELPNPIVTSETLIEYRLPESIAQTLMEKLELSGLKIDAHTASLKTSDTNFAILPNQYFAYACYFYDFANELIKYFQLLKAFQSKCSSIKINPAEILFGRSDEVKAKIESHTELQECFENSDDIDLFCKFLDQEESSHRLGAKNPINSNNGFSVRGYGNCFGSVILTQINLPNVSSSIFGDLVYALVNMPAVFSQLKKHHNNFVVQQPSRISYPQVLSKIPTSTPKPFILLAGISGTGKTRFVRDQAKVHKGNLSNYCLIPVRPDWHEPSDLLGYVSRIGTPRYVVTELLSFVVKAWKNAAQSATVDAIVIKPVNDMTPYWLCLDEMNLAPVEQYFADYLSVLESREWADDGYRCLPLLKAELFNKDEGITEQLRMDLGLGDAAYTELWNYFKTTGIPLPPNLIVAGTVNMDETTHGFSRKVIDRAFTIDFGAFFPNDFSHYFAPATVNKTLSFPVLSKVEQSDLSNVTADPDGSKSIAFLNAINKVLKNTPFELAFRALNELLISLVCFQPEDDAALQAVWDDFLMTKVLPRIDGDGHKLGLDGEESLLTKLEKISKDQMPAIWDAQRPDLLRENIDQSPQPSPLLINCRSAQKLQWMQKRLADNSFTSFWP